MVVLVFLGIFPGVVYSLLEGCCDRLEMKDKLVFKQKACNFLVPRYESYTGLDLKPISS